MYNPKLTCYPSGALELHHYCSFCGLLNVHIFTFLRRPWRLSTARRRRGGSGSARRCRAAARRTAWSATRSSQRSSRQRRRRRWRPQRSRNRGSGVKYGEKYTLDQYWPIGGAGPPLVLPQLTNNIEMSRTLCGVSAFYRIWSSGWKYSEIFLTGIVYFLLRKVD